MKKETYSCDRCGAELCEGYSPSTLQFATETQIRHRIRFFKKWKNDFPTTICHDLCEKCRNSLDEWLEGK
jgi:hypothetical protein